MKWGGDPTGRAQGDKPQLQPLGGPHPPYGGKHIGSWAPSLPVQLGMLIVKWNEDMWEDSLFLKGDFSVFDYENGHISLSLSLSLSLYFFLNILFWSKEGLMNPELVMLRGYHGCFTKLFYISFDKFYNNIFWYS